MKLRSPYGQEALHTHRKPGGRAPASAWAVPTRLAKASQRLLPAQSSPSTRAPPALLILPANHRLPGASQFTSAGCSRVSARSVPREDAGTEPPPHGSLGPCTFLKDPLQEEPRYSFTHRGLERWNNLPAVT